MTTTKCGHYGFSQYLVGQKNNEYKLRINRRISQPLALQKGDVFVNGLCFRKIQSESTDPAIIEVIDGNKTKLLDVDIRLPIALLDISGGIVNQTYRTDSYSLPEYLKEGDILATGARIMGRPKLSLYSVMIWLKFGKQIYSMEIEYGIPVALLNLKVDNPPQEFLEIINKS